MTTADRVVVVGGGFAGMAAACRLAGDGFRPIVLERAPRLGGRSSSFQDPATGEQVDYGHHVTMRCCTATHGFLQRVRAGSFVRYQPRLQVPLLCGERRAELRSSPLLPGPIHLAPGLLRYRCLSIRERLGVGRAAASLMVTRAREVSFGSWLRRCSQGARAIARLWEPICVATLNASVDQVSVSAARRVIRDGFLFPEGAGLGLFTGPLARIFDAAARYVESRDGEVRTSAGVRRILVGRGSVRGVELATGETIGSSAVVVAVPPWDLAALVEAPALRSVREAARGLVWAPIVNVHAWFDRAILDDEFLIAVDSPVQAVFDVASIHGLSGHRLAISQSAASAWIDRDPDEIAAELVAELRRLLPAARAARLVRRLVIKHRRATFVLAPGSATLRPRLRTTIGGLYLAGDWTSTGWPSTIEGAIRSGVAAAGRAAVDMGADAEDVDERS